LRGLRDLPVSLPGVRVSSGRQENLWWGGAREEYKRTSVGPQDQETDFD